MILNILQDLESPISFTGGTAVGAIVPVDAVGYRYILNVQPRSKLGKVHQVRVRKCAPNCKLYVVDHGNGYGLFHCHVGIDAMSL